jgi:hypothetical protein
MSTLLLFNIPPHKRARIQVLAIQNALKVKAVPPEQAGNTLLEILSGAPVRPVDKPFTEEMLVMVDLRESQLDKVLTGLLRQNVPVSLKAVMTAANAGWTAQELYSELCRERAAVAGRGKAHP